jgi:hypothetical protein
MRGKRFAQRCSSEVGSVLPFIALGLTTLLLFLALALDQGVLYVGRTQLQQLVDASSRAALLALARQGATRQDAIDAANEVAANNTLMQGGIANANFNVVFGTYNFVSGSFFPESMPVGTPQAVRISIGKSGARSFDSLMGGDINVNAESIAALRCRNVVFLQDVSASFAEDIVKIQNALRTTVSILALQDSFSSIGTRVGLVAFRNIVVPAATTPMLVPPGDASIRNAINQLSNTNVVCDDPRTLGVIPSCVGTDMKAALERAAELLAAGRGRLESCEDLIVAVSDGVPCRVTEEDIDPFRFSPPPPGEQAGGGSTKEETLAFVESAMRSTRSIAVLTTNSGTRDGRGPFTERFAITRCPEQRGLSDDENNEIDREFADKLVSGFGQSFDSDRSETELAEQMNAALRSVPPVIVD